MKKHPLVILTEQARLAQLNANRLFEARDPRFRGAYWNYERLENDRRGAVTGLKVETEDDLYQLVMASAELLDAHKKWRVLRGEADILGADQQFRPHEVDLLGKHLYVIGERHLSKAPVQYAHSSVVPLINRNPSDWLVLHEDINPRALDPYVAGSHFYFQELVRIYSLPEEEAKVSALDATQHKDLERVTGMTRQQIEWVALWSMMSPHFLQTFSNPKDEAEHYERELNMASQKLCKPVDYLHGIIQQGKVPEAEIQMRLLVDGVNVLTRERLPDVLSRHTDRTKAIVSIGQLHIPAYLQ